MENTQTRYTTTKQGQNNMQNFPQDMIGVTPILTLGDELATCITVVPELPSSETIVAITRSRMACQERQRIYEERRWQAHSAFIVALGLTTASATLSIMTAAFLYGGNLAVGVATAAVGLTSGAVSANALKLYQEANDRLDAAARDIGERVMSAR